MDFVPLLLLGQNCCAGSACGSCGPEWWHGEGDFCARPARECVLGRAVVWYWLPIRPCQAEPCPTCQGNAELPPLLLLPS